MSRDMVITDLAADVEFWIAAKPVPAGDVAPGTAQRANESRYECAMAVTDMIASRRSRRGFSIIELLMVVAIGATDGR